jgi:hypothetical protein
MKPIDRRRFFIQGTSLAAAAMSTLAAGAQPKEGGRQLGTCGPPPRRNPERQTSAEGMPPLPLPAVPLRRSEPKAEPAPPLMIAKLDYGTTQDWNTDPGDVDNLMRHVRSGLGLWYGWKQLSIAELVAIHKAKKILQIPALYISGHEAFTFTADQRDALRQYMVDGGTLIGDACCGRDEFTKSFRSEMRELFPDRTLDRLELDHPIYRAFYKYATVNYISYSGVVKNEYSAAPEILGMNLGCRTAVLLSPHDLSCGWDEHTHPRGSRLLPGDAIRLGINLISYIAALRQLAEAQATTKEFANSDDRKREQFVLAQLRHQGDWNPDPNSTYQMLRHLASESSLAVSFDLKYVDPTESKVAPYPFLFLTGFRNPKLKNEEVGALRRHLQAGGFLFVNNCSGYNAFDKSIRDIVKQMFSGAKLEPLGKDHAFFKSFHTIAEARDRQTGQPREIEMEGVTVKTGTKSRTVLIYSKNDMVTHLKQVSDPFGNGYDADTCRKLVVNMVAYAMQH